MGKVEVVGTNWEAFLMLLFYSCIVPLGFLPGNFGLLLPGKASCDRVVLPNLWCMPGLIVFPQSTSPRAHLLVVGMLLFMSDINQPCLPTPFFFLYCSCVCFCLYVPFNCISFHNFYRQLSISSLSSSGLTSSLFVLSTICLFRKVPTALM